MISPILRVELRDGRHGELPEGAPFRVAFDDDTTRDDVARAWIRRTVPLWTLDLDTERADGGRMVDLIGRDPLTPVCAWQPIDLPKR